MTAPPQKKVITNCLKKQRYSDEFAARAGAQSRLQFLGWKDGLGVYRCDLCRGWHLTSKHRPRYFRVTDTDVFPTLTERITP